MVRIVKVDEGLWDSAIDTPVTIFDGKYIKMGIVSLSPGKRLPEEGYSVHEDFDEYAYVLSGKIAFYTDGSVYHLEDGDFLFNEGGAPHYTVNIGDEDAKIFWVLCCVKKCGGVE
jgi:quercetin dioxygenase-like cupin family protein